MSDSSELKFLDGEGRLTQWPSKHAGKVLALAYLAGKFDHGVTYSEAEVNSILKRWHTFSDWPLLRRELFDRGFIDRNIDGTNYRLKELPTSMDRLVLVRPNVERDAAFGVSWLSGDEGRRTLRLMGSTEQDNKPSTLGEEQKRVRGFITATKQTTWMIMYQGKVVGVVWADFAITKYLGAPAVHIMIGSPEVRGRGVGLAVLRALISQLEAYEHDEYLYSRHLLENEVVSKLFRKVGFKDNGVGYQDSDGLRWQNVRYKLQER